MRRRPEIHFTPDHGWMNDPHGIVFADGRYHLFYQYNPAATEWHHHLSWGHAVSTDLVHWTELAPAIDPLDDEVGLWSGSVVIADAPTMFYTLPHRDDWSHGQVVAARGNPDLTSWQRLGIVVGGPPSDEFRDFRDPHVRRDGSRWRMTLGAGKRDLTGGCALQYSSSDLTQWTYDGVLAAERFDATAPINHGQVWECPQFLPIDGQWMLTVSAMEMEQTYVLQIYALGDYDGVQFTPRRWGNFGHGQLPYAMTTFTDADGAPCAMAWLRESGVDVPSGSPWAGAQSIVHELRISGDRLLAPFHRNLDAVLPAVMLQAGTVAGATRFRFLPRAFAIADTNHYVEFAFAADRVVVQTDGVTVLDEPAATTAVDIVIDAEWVEFVCDGVEGIFVVKLPVMTSPSIVLR